MSVILLIAAVAGLVLFLLWPVKRVRRRRAPVILLRRSDDAAPTKEPDPEEEATQQALFLYLLGRILPRDEPDGR